MARMAARTTPAAFSLLHGEEPSAGRGLLPRDLDRYHVM